MGKNEVFIGQFDTEHRSGKDGHNFSFKLNRVFYSHNGWRLFGRSAAPAVQPESHQHANWAFFGKGAGESGMRVTEWLGCVWFLLIDTKGGALLQIKRTPPKGLEIRF